MHPPDFCDQQQAWVAGVGSFPTRCGQCAELRVIQTGPGASAPPSFHPKWEPIEVALKTCEPVHLTKPFCVFGHWAISVFLASFEGGGHCLGSFVALILDGEACVLFCFLFFLFFFAHEHACASRGLSNNIDPLSPLGASLQGYAKRDTTNWLAPSGRAYRRSAARLCFSRLTPMGRYIVYISRTWNPAFPFFC